AAYTAQHFALLARGLHRHPPVQASWVGLAALALIARRFTRGEPSLSREALADRLSLTTGEVERILHPLVTQGLLKMHDDHGYGLAADPHELDVEKILAAYDRRARRGAELVGGEIAARLEELIGDLASVRSGTLGTLTVADLLKPPQAAEASSLSEPAPAGTIPPSRTVGQ